MSIGEREIAQHHIENGRERLKSAVETLMLGDYLYRPKHLEQMTRVIDGTTASVSVNDVDAVRVVNELGLKITLIEPYENGWLIEFTN